MTLDPFWSAAARLTGKVDFLPLEPLLRHGPPPGARELARAGLTAAQVATLVRGDWLPVPGDAITMVDDRWPPALQQVPFAPPVLFYRGELALLQRPAIAIVGSRHCTVQGQRMARLLAQAVAGQGGVVVSGLAHGIDHAAHQASLSRTIAVLGQGLDAPLTARQAELARQVVQRGGLLLSELPPECRATRWTFPQRNRIIAGLAAATVVVEAAERSGALITARQALALGRDVLAVPGSPLDPASAGCLDLIASGAGLARDGRDLARYLPAPAAPGGEAQPPAGVDPRAWAQLARGASADQIALVLEWPSHRVAALLAGLELTGRVERLPGDRFALRARSDG